MCNYTRATPMHNPVGRTQRDAVHLEFAVFLSAVQHGCDRSRSLGSQSQKKNTHDRMPTFGILLRIYFHS